MNPEESFSEIGSEETVLWEGRQSSNTVWRAAACNGWLPVLLLWLFCHMFLFTDIWRDILNGHPVLFLFGYLLPVWGYLYKGYKLFRNGESAHYCITDKAIYASYKGRKICKPLSEICRTEYLKGRLSDVSDVGTVRCVYRKLNGRVPDPDESAEFCILLRMVDDYRKVGKILDHACREEREAEKERNLQRNTAATDSAELPSLVTEETAAGRDAEQTGQLPEEALSMPEMPAFDFPKHDPDEPLIFDPVESFFGMPPQKQTVGFGQSAFFMEERLPDGDIESFLPDDSVQSLQQELFGTEAVRTQVFPDPTVNPLPALKEQPEGLLMQDTEN